MLSMQYSLASEWIYTITFSGGRIMANVIFLIVAAILLIISIFSLVSYIVSVQREPSGHNLKHPTKWCPPNK